MGLDAGTSVPDGAYFQNLSRRSGNWKVREGFGQLCQFDTTLGRGTVTSPATAVGYQAHLGTYSMRTDFGHIQHITILTSMAFGGSHVTRGKWDQHFAVSIYDETTGDRWEEVLFRHTSANNPNIFSMMDWRGHYETGRGAIPVPPSDDFDSTVAASADGPVFFCEYRDYLMFGNRTMGLWCYAPCSFGGTRIMQLDGIRRREAYEGYSESSRVFPIVAADGLFAAAYAYFTATSYPAPADACSVAGRLVMGLGRELYFSDIGRPGSVMGVNVLALPLEQEITGIAEQFGNILIFSTSETWLYRMPVGSAIVTAGDLVRLSSTIGCPNPQAKCKAKDLLVWGDSHGIYTTTGNYQVAAISHKISRLFQDGIPNPLLHFYQTTQAGYTGTDAPHQRMQFLWKDIERLNLAYDDQQDLLFVCNPDEGIVLCQSMSEDAWSVWTFVSMVQPTAATVGVTTTINCRAITCKDGEVYCVGGMDTYTAVDATIIGGTGVPAGENFTTQSFYLLQRGRGGGLDRSVEAQEDNRQFTGFYENVVDNLNDLAYFLLDKLIQVPAGYTLPQGTVMTTGGYLLPVLISPDAVTVNVQQPDSLTLIFHFDNTHWRPVVIPGGGPGRIDTIVDTARLASQLGWGIVTPVALAETRVYSAGAPNNTGNQIRLRWSGATPPLLTFDNQPQMNLPSRGLFPLLYIPVERVAATITDSVSSLGVEFVPPPGGTDVAFQDRVALGTTASIGLFVWKPAEIRNKNAGDNQATPVDWVWKSAQFGFDEPFQTRLRDIYASVMGRGRASAPLVVGWLYGLFNTVTSSDWKDWSAQIVDFGIFENVRQAKTALRSRILSGGTMVPKTWTNGVTIWGESGTAATGNVLVDDEALDTVAVSEGVKGEHVSTMLFGHIMNRAESLLLRSVKLGLQPRGGRRRRGR